MFRIWPTWSVQTHGNMTKSSTFLCLRTNARPSSIWLRHVFDCRSAPRGECSISSQPLAAYFADIGHLSQRIDGGMYGGGRRHRARHTPHTVGTCPSIPPPSSTERNRALAGRREGFAQEAAPARNGSSQDSQPVGGFGCSWQ